MGEKLVVGPIDRGLKTNRTAFVIDNDSFPTLINAYQWRGRVKRKRGTRLLGRLTRYFNSSISSYNSPTGTITLDASGNGNLITDVSLQTNSQIVPGTILINAVVSMVSYTDPAMDGTLSPSGTINYTTGALHIAAEANNALVISFNYNPDLPVMGIEDFVNVSAQFPGTIAFDTTYSYNILTVSPYIIYDVSFYKNPPVDPVKLPGYVPKTFVTPTSWNGQDYQQFWTVNYQGALWATNGINVPFSPTNIGMQFKPITTVTVGVPGPPATATLHIIGHGLVIGDFIFVNEVVGTTGINFQTGYVNAVFTADDVGVTFPFATLAGNGTGGIAQYLTNRSDQTKDSLRWYDGDPTSGNPSGLSLTGHKGWVNFAPPLSQFSYSIADLPAPSSPLSVYYLVGARMIVPFKDRLLFIGPVVQTSSDLPIYLQDTVIYSQNGTPYYTASFTAGANYPLPPVTTPPGYVPILVPLNQTATPSAYFEDQTGFGGFITAGIDQAIITASPNKDVLILGFDRSQAKLAYTGNDIVPFNFYTINSEYGSGSTFSIINMDQGVLTRGSRGYLITNQVECERIDLDIPDKVFDINLVNNGSERVTAQRDYLKEWVYFTYPVDSQASGYRFPNQTLLYNYRDNSWAIFNETYTTYGLFRRQTGFIWSTVGLTYPTWSAWNASWDSGESNLLQVELLAGNQQGFILFRDEGTAEDTSLYIQAITGNFVTSPDHSLNTGDYIIISGIIGAISSQVNGKIFKVGLTKQNTFTLDPVITTDTYLGGGLITRLSVPFIQTKQFPEAWSLGRKTRIGMQQYLLTRTQNAQITLLIFLSQDGNQPYNEGPIVPDLSPNNSLIYSTVLYTCPESTNLGLTPANVNLQMPTALSQAQIWHRVNTSLIGDTVQLGFTLSEEQMRSLIVSGSPFAITGVTQANPAVLSIAKKFNTGQLIYISGVTGMTQLNGNIYYIISSTDTDTTIDVDSTAFDAYVSGGTATLVAPVYQSAEIEIHGFIIDVSASQVLA